MTKFETFKAQLSELSSTFDLDNYPDRGLDFDEMLDQIRQSLQEKTGVYIDINFMGTFPSSDSHGCMRDVFALTTDFGVFYIGFDLDVEGFPENSLFTLESYTSEELKERAEKLKMRAISDALIVCMDNRFMIFQN